MLLTLRIFVYYSCCQSWRWTYASILYEMPNEGRDQESAENNNEKQEAGYKGRMFQVRYQGVQDR